MNVKRTFRYVFSWLERVKVEEANRPAMVLLRIEWFQKDSIPSMKGQEK